MAVYTKIGQSEIISITKKFKLNKIIKFQGIKKGIENTNYLLKTKKNKYILTIFEKRVKKKDLPFFMKLMDKLNSYNISCPKPLKNKNGKYLTLIKKKTACIVTFVNGQDKKTLNIQNCYKIGKNIAKLHRTSKKIKLFRKNSMSINSLDPLLKSIKFKSKNISPNLQSVLTQSLNKIKKDWPKKLPKGIIHGDLFIDNIFFKKNKFAGFIDFYFSCTDYFMYELAICVNALCFDKKNNKFIINNKKIKSLIKGYESVKKISLKEKNSLNILCRGAALRYLLTRVYDYFNTPKNTLIKIKDPKEYFQKLIIHNNLNSYQNYYN
jgi:homoserine kinase type II